MTVPQDLADWLEEYTAAFNALDGDAVADLCAEPCQIVQGGRVEHWPDRAAVAANMRALCTQYRENGYQHAQAAIRDCRVFGAGNALLDIHWRIVRSGDLPPWTFNTAYQLLNTAGDWRVLLCVAYEESPL
ncbi:nuclear transport factor 2 family protein [Chitinilyticum aquatile]|uniref:nuclear transport factor 2 family protein n=1 Tax=Chitinilyticum aquatile TaxID=362520 RepID=UPI000421521E|nr:nuclear transport factor 2 family protein [Chitinilyticum aquatile]